MFRKHIQYPDFVHFFLPFCGHLGIDNRWMCMAKLTSWAEGRQPYENLFGNSCIVVLVKNVRIALGALIVKECLRLSKKQTEKKIWENPYLQYFVVN